MPIVPIELRLQNAEAVRCNGLLDTGSMVNVLPFGLGLQLGAQWDRQPVLPPLGGNLANHEARGLLVECCIAGFEPLQLAFAWTRSDEAPLLLGQTNFFHEFDADFQACLRQFQIRLAAKPEN